MRSSAGSHWLNRLQSTLGRDKRCTCVLLLGPLGCGARDTRGILRYRSPYLNGVINFYAYVGVYARVVKQENTAGVRPLLAETHGSSTLPPSTLKGSMTEYHTLLLTPSMQPHRIVCWQDAICKLVEGEIEVLESYDETVSSPSVTFQIPSVARIKNPIPANKKGVKFSRINVLTRDNFQCQYCGNRFPRRQLNYDHVVPRCQGGKTVWQNVVSSCLSCNSRKGGRTPEQARMQLLKPPTRPKWLPLQMPAVPIRQAPESWRFYLGHIPHIELAFV